MRLIIGAAVTTFLPWSSFTSPFASAAPAGRGGVGVHMPDTGISGPSGMTFRVDQVANPKFHGAGKGSGVMALVKAYLKYGVPLPDDLRLYLGQVSEELGLTQKPKFDAGTETRNDAVANPQGDVAATPDTFDSEYLCYVQIGTPPQTLHVDFDTASSDFWVFSSETPPNLVNGQTIFDIQKSSTATLLNGESWQVQYGDGSNAGGDVYSDVVSIGGILVKNQAVESATRVSLSLTQRTSVDGILGLSFSGLNTVTPDRKPSVFDSVVESLADPLFTANLKSAEPGDYNFGYIDASEFTGPITYVPVNTSGGFWQFTVQDFVVGNEAPVTAPHEAIADTGTTLLLLPDDITAAYYAQIPGATNVTRTSGGYVFPCSVTPPSYTAIIGPYQAVVPGEFIKHSPADSDSFADATLCFGGIQTVTSGFPASIYGDVFLKSQFVVFHGGELQLGLAAKPL